MSQKPRKKSAASPAQLALVGILALVLIGVLASHWSGAKSPPSDAADNAEVEEAASNEEPADGSTKATTPQGPFGEFAADEPWPELTVKNASEFDPLATPAWANAAPDVEAIAERQHGEDKLNELRNAQNIIIITAGNKKIARIGNQEFQVGDTVGGFKITDISFAGVVLSEID